MLKGKFQERTVELKWAQEPSITLRFWFRSEMAQTSEQCFIKPKSLVLPVELAGPQPAGPDGNAGGRGD